MKYLATVISVSFLLCFTIGCKQNVIDSKKAASVISDAFELDQNDKLEITEFSMDSQKTALAKFSLNRNQLSSKITKTDAGWLVSEIQDKEDKWVPAEYFFKIKGKLIDQTDKAYANQTVTLYELTSDAEGTKTSIKVGEGGILLNPSTLTDAEGNFTIIADRRFWEGSGEFTLGVSGMGNEGYLRDQNNIIISIKADKKAKHVDLGEIRVGY